MTTKLTPEAITIAGAIAILGGMIYWLRQAMPVGAMQPRFETQGADIAGMYSDVTAPIPTLTFVPHEPMDYRTVTLPVRYPVKAGTNISALIEHGFAPLWRPRPQNYDWLANPPSEMGFS